MVKKCLFLLAAFLVLSVGIQAAAIVSCSQPGFSQTITNGNCVVGAHSNDTLIFGAFSGASISSGILQFEAFAEVLDTPRSNPGPYPMSASATWDDVFLLPVSNPADILKVTVTGGGLNHPASIHAGPIDFRQTNFCDLHYFGNPACTQTVTLSAAGLSSVELTGADSISIIGACGFSNCGVGANADLFELVTVQRFLADGVTLDPFTDLPEPSSLALLLLAIPVGIALGRRS